jgi:hypothetical protein
MRKVLSLLAIVLIATLVGPGQAMAACSPDQSNVDGLAQARTVFVGRVVDLANNDRTATFDVQWVWKGSDVAEQATVVGGSDDPTVVGSDDRRFQQGITYLVVSRSAVPPYESDACTATQPYNQIGSVIPTQYQEAVGAAIGSAPDEIVGAEEAGSSLLSSPVWTYGAIAAVVVGLLFGLGRLLRGPEHAPQKRRRTKKTQSRLPSVGRSGEGLTGGLRRSGASQADKLRGRRTKRSSKPKKAKGKTGAAKKGALRTDRLSGSADADSDAVDEATSVGS